MLIWKEGINVQYICLYCITHAHFISICNLRLVFTGIPQVLSRNKAGHREQYIHVRLV